MGVESEATLDWNRQEGERWAMPLQASVSKVARVGALSVNLLPGGRWYALCSGGRAGPGLRLAVSFVVLISREEARDDGEKKGPDSEAD